MEAMRELHRRVASDRRVRWFLVAGVFTAAGLGLLKVFVEVFHWHYAASTFVQSEACNLARFFVNDRWVFGRARPTWRRLWQYHVANALGFAVWWAGANALKAAGVNYLLASVLAMFGSVGVSLLTNFKWIWRKRRSAPGPERLRVDANWRE
jgi:putative flippase GtrA